MVILIVKTMLNVTTRKFSFKLRFSLSIRVIHDGDHSGFIVSVGTWCTGNDCPRIILSKAYKFYEV